MFNYDCPNCNQVVKLVSMDGMLEGECKNCGFEISIEKAEWLQSKLDLI
jgi:DNA-directed RNA polymerase subunit RPC12/RpoP